MKKSEIQPSPLTDSHFKFIRESVEAIEAKTTRVVRSPDNRIIAYRCGDVIKVEIRGV